MYNYNNLSATIKNSDTPSLKSRVQETAFRKNPNAVSFLGGLYEIEDCKVNYSAEFLSGGACLSRSPLNPPFGISGRPSLSAVGSKLSGNSG